MSKIKVRLLKRGTVNVKLKPKNGIKVKNDTTYLYDPTLVADWVDLAEDWATKTDGKVEEEGVGIDYSSKAYAIGGTGTQTNNAKYYASESNIWAEGTDAQVSEFGGTHSAKGWAEYSIDVWKGYVHEQGVASSTWNVQHNLNKYPSVIVVDSAKNEIVADIQYIDENNVVITMNGASKGFAYLN